MAKAKSRYVPALDGMRALAVLAVIAYHMNMKWALGGLLGVTMFFVLSGYLITGLLIKEYDETGTISLKGFWLRRVRRIIPAVLFAVIGIAFLCTIFNHALLTKMRPDVLPTLFFVNNWWQIVHDVSYFQALGDPSPLTHFWSLAIEEQFYLVWPLVLIVCMKFGVSRSAMTKGTAVLAALSVIEMIVLFDPAQDPSRVYYGTDTRAFSLLIGALLAFVWPYQELTEKAGEDMSPRGRLIFNLVGVAGVVGLLAMVAFTNGFEPFIYRGGLLLCSLLTAVTIAVLVHPISWISKVFQLAPFVWIGKCSYSMYLWHYPIILLMTSSNLVGEAPIWLRLVQLAVIFGVSAFSYYVVENPIRHGAIGDWLGRLGNREFTVGEWVSAHLVPVVVSAAFVLVAIGGLIFVPDTQSVNVDAIQAGQDNEESADVSAIAEEQQESFDILLIGDSVVAALDGYGVFYDEFPFGHVDGSVGRQFSEAADLYKQYEEAGLVGDVVVFALGTNGYVQDSDADALVQAVGDKRIWLVNTRTSADYMEASNAAIQRCVDKYDNVYLIDWYTLSATYGEDIFDGDGTHLTVDGCQIYADMILEATKDSLPERSRDPQAARAEKEKLEREQAAADQAQDGSSDDSADSSQDDESGESGESGDAAADDEA